MSMPNMMNIGHIFLTESACLEYLIDQGVLTIPTFCDTCGEEGMGHPKLKLYQCTKKHCRSKQSIFKGTFFSNSRIPCNKIMLAAYKFLNKDASSSIVREIRMLGLDFLGICF
jgi:hypothetical protein